MKFFLFILTFLTANLLDYFLLSHSLKIIQSSWYLVVVSPINFFPRIKIEEKYSKKLLLNAEKYRPKNKEANHETW